MFFILFIYLKKDLRLATLNCQQNILTFIFTLLHGL